MLCYGMLCISFNGTQKKLILYRDIPVVMTIHRESFCLNVYGICAKNLVNYSDRKFIHYPYSYSRRDKKHLFVSWFSTGYDRRFFALLSSLLELNYLRYQIPVHRLKAYSYLLLLRNSFISYLLNRRA